MTPVIIIGGKIFGWFTATESAAVAVLYAGALSIFVYREVDFKGVLRALSDTGKFASVTLAYQRHIDYWFNNPPRSRAVVPSRVPANLDPYANMEKDY